MDELRNFDGASRQVSKAVTGRAQNTFQGDCETLPILWTQFRRTRLEMQNSLRDIRLTRDL
jgi:hypothetical protein